jgi:anthranilate 1,2-dioxygenase small subunit
MSVSHTAEEARSAIEFLMSRYVTCLDDGALEDWPGLFTEDGCYRITTRENHSRNLPLGIMDCIGRGMMTDRVVAFRRVNVYEPHTYRHQYSALRIEPTPSGSYRCRTNFLVVRTMQDGSMSIFATGLYEDEIVFEATGPHFRDRLVICDSRRIDTLLVIPL